MAQGRYDLSQIGATMEQTPPVDLTHLGAVPVMENAMPQGGMQPNQFNPGFFEKLAPNILAGLAQMGHSLINAPSNIAQYAASKGAISPETAQAIPRQQDYDYAAMLKLPNTTSDQIVQSLTKNAPAMAIPALRGAGLLPALSRIGGQAAWGGLTNDNPAQGAGEFGGMQALFEALTPLAKPVAWAAEAINPQKYAGKIAEQIRNYAQAGYKEAQPYYKPAEEYFGNNITVDPKKYLGFEKDDLQYFKAPAKKAYNDFVAEPTLGNLHDLQSKMGMQPELGGWRQGIKDKIASYLHYQDPEALASYQKGSDIMRDKYYPYTANDILENITQYEKPITKYNPNTLAKGLSNAPIVQQSEKALTPLDHPLVGLAESLQNRMNRAKMYQYGVPAALGAMTGHLIEPGLGGLFGAGTGAAFGKFGEPQLLGLAQNPEMLKILETLNRGLQGAGSQAVGYHMYNQ